MGDIENRRVAVLLAAYNGENWIEEQINSILQQSLVSVTLYISVDLSKDQTYELVSDIAAKNSNVVLLEYGSRYGSAAANFLRLIRSVDYKEYDYVALADQDDYWFEGKINRAINVMASNNAEAYSSDVIATWPDGRKRLLKKSYPQTRYDHLFESPGPGCTFVMKTEVLSEFCENYDQYFGITRQLTTNHDWFIYAYARFKGYYWIIDDQPNMYYRQHLDNQVGMNSGLRAYMHRLRLIRSRWYRGQVIMMFDVFAPREKNKVLLGPFRFMHCFKFRRRPRDKFALFFMMSLGLF